MFEKNCFGCLLVYLFAGLEKFETKKKSKENRKVGFSLEMKGRVNNSWLGSFRQEFKEKSRWVSSRMKSKYFSLELKEKVDGFHQNDRVDRYLGSGHDGDN